MTRLTFALAVSLMASPALAGPPLEQPAPAPAPAEAGGGATIYDCQIAGRTERFVIADGALAEGAGSLSVLTEDVYVVTRNGVTYFIDPTGVQIDQGVDAGKWPCVETAAAPAPAEPDVNQMARIVELETQVANLQAALSAANGERDAAIAAREAALVALDGAQAASGAAATAAQTALAEAAALQSQAEIAESAAAAAIAAQAGAEARVVELEAAAAADAVELEQMRASQGQLAEALAAAEARVAELELALAASMAVSEEDVAEDDMTEEADDSAEGMGDAADSTDEDMSEDHSAMEAGGFDADAALMAIDAAELSPISRAALTAAVEQARANPDLVAEVVTRLQNALGE
ncbi:hypothetical protein [Nioella aestuarii]|uniref:hypothetical protein n=1 Tax=Nioella aestuarii TaxID=1662864 RepID=UPI003D7F7474